MRNPILKNLAVDYINTYPDWPNRTLAKLMRNEHPDIFTSIESARFSIRAYKGLAGEKNMRALKITNPHPKSSQQEGMEKLKSLIEKNKHQQEADITLGAGKYGVISDIHFPFQDDAALYTAIDFLVKQNITGLILNGDIIDCYAISRFAKERRDVHLFDEIEMCRDFLNALQQIFPDIPMWYRVGNHDMRIDRFIVNQAPELMGLDGLSLAGLLRLKEMDIHIIEKGIIKAGKLNILHGHEFGESIFSPVNPARGVFLKSKSSTLIGHYHQKSEHSEGNLNGDVVGCWSTGCLCKLTPSYRPFAYTKWNHGFAVVDVFDDGMFEVNNHIIINGKVR